MLTKSFGLLLSSLWTFFTWELEEWLTTPWQVVLVLVMLLVSPLLAQSKRWRRSLSYPAAIALGIYLLLATPLGAGVVGWGFTQWNPPDTGERVDAIVVLGRGPEADAPRVATTTALWSHQRAPLIFVSGVDDAPKIAAQLRDAGVPNQAVRGEACSRTTEENSRFTSALLYPQGVRRILLVTDTPHMLRSRLVFQRYGFKVLAAPCELPQHWRPIQRSILALREYSGLISYALMGRFQSRLPLEAAPATLEQLKNRFCKL